MNRLSEVRDGVYERDEGRREDEREMKGNERVLATRELGPFKRKWKVSTTSVEAPLQM